MKAKLLFTIGASSILCSILATAATQLAFGQQPSVAAGGLLLSPDGKAAGGVAADRFGQRSPDHRSGKEVSPATLQRPGLWATLVRLQRPHAGKLSVFLTQGVTGRQTP
jgi:hypothetical protein